LLAELASVGELGALIGDLLKRVRYALGEYPTLPERSARETTYVLRLPDHSAARACQEQLIAWGGSDVTVGEIRDGSGWQVRATFPELAPDPSYEGTGPSADAAGQRARRPLRECGPMTSRRPRAAAGSTQPTDRFVAAVESIPAGAAASSTRSSFLRHGGLRFGRRSREHRWIEGESR
jgi:hypothetical protein